MELTTDQKGAIAEAAVAFTAIRLGIGVLRPLSDGHRYDLVFDLHGELLRVQCKWALYRNGVVSVYCYSSRRARAGLVRTPYGRDEIDAIAAYSAELDRCFYVPAVTAASRTFIHLRVTPARNNQRAGINWADDYALERLPFHTVPGP